MLKSEDQKKYDNKIKKLLINNFLNSIYFFINKFNVSNILDIGCGEGYPDNFFLNKNSNLKITGIDSNSSFLKKAKIKNPKVNYLIGNIYDLSFIKNKTDLVLCMEVLEHLKDPQKALSEIKKKSQKTIISVPYEPWFSIMSLFSGNYLRNFGRHPDHINSWNKKRFKQFLLHQYDDVKIKISFPWIIGICK
jgi:2-polyprenyl-3-methyl-5-hydroxy-6-metoxy-1,4-benzoquinol methylase